MRIGRDPNPMTSILKNGSQHTDMHPGRRQVKMKAGMGVKHLQVKEYPRWSTNHQRLARRPGAETLHDALKEPTLLTSRLLVSRGAREHISAG